MFLKARATSSEFFEVKDSASLQGLATWTTVRAYLKTLFPLGSMLYGRKRRYAWCTALGVGTSNFGLGAGRQICQSACLIRHFFEGFFWYLSVFG